MTFGPSQGSARPLIMPLNTPWFLCRSRRRYPQVLQATLYGFVAERHTLDDPRDLTGETTAQTGLYAHLGQDTAEPLVTDRPP
jgi:hypothetical protein